MEVNSFAEIEQTFIERVHSVVWCNVATVDAQGRPRSRILHPYWEGAIGWIATGRHTHKTKHLTQNPYVSLAYIADLSKPVYVDCRAEWVDTMEAKQHLWDLFNTTPPPLGYPMADFFKSIDHPNYGVLKLTPWRIEVADFPGTTQVWHAKGTK